MGNPPLILIIVLTFALIGLGVLFLLSTAWLASARHHAPSLHAATAAEWVVLRTYSTPELAHLDRVMLEGCGIPVRLANEHTVGTDWMYGIAVGVDLRVPQDQVENAEQLLGDARAGDASVDLDDASWPIRDAELQCTQCGSPEVYRVRPSAGWSIALVVFLGLPLLRRRRYQCEACGNPDALHDSG